MLRYPFLAAALLSVMAAPRPISAADDAAATPEQARFFEAEIRPVLVDQCIKCHGPEKQKANLRLDSREGLLAGGDSGPAVEAGEPAESLLIAAIGHGDEVAKMPPSRKLPEAQVAALTQWVKDGAPWPGGSGAAPAASSGGLRKGKFAITDADRAHWAFRPVVCPTPPGPVDGTHPIDAFIRAGLSAKGLRPNPPASPIELIRRATYDLTGLPPTPAEVDAFVADPADDAYAKVVDRLLASPRYGEKWGRHWLDLVRFAETNSYERDNAKPNAWRYRDYVIRAFNDDIPYDRFVREQLAGDELADRGNESYTATGFYRLGIWDDEPTDRDQAFYDGLDDIVATTGQVFLGLTIDCARCHDHKLDPIPQKDYYRLLSFFRNVNRFRNGGPTDERSILEPAAEAAFEKRRRELETTRSDLFAGVAAFREEFRKAYSTEKGEEIRPIDFEGLRYRFYRDTWDALPDFDEAKSESKGELPRQLIDLSPRTRDEAFGFVFEGQLLVPSAGTYTFHLDSNDGSRLSIGGKVVAEHDGLHGLGWGKSASVDLPAGRVPLRLDYFQKKDGLGLELAWSGPGFARRMLSGSSKGESQVGPRTDIAALIRKEGVRVMGVVRFAKYRVLLRRLKELDGRKLAPDSALVVTEKGRSAPETHVMARGNPHTPGDPVGPAFPEVLGGQVATIPEPSSDAKTTGRRLVLADWIASPANPLTARVMANRLWQHHFSRGIVRSTSNFGLQGDKPTHPELLDWLAAELVSGGWRLKPLHRTIMLSDAYRMSSRADADAIAKDPSNDGFWRFEMRRLGAEEIRDSVLAVGGTLNTAMYGPGIYPEIPAEVLAGQSIPGYGWGNSSTVEQARRSIYIHVKRSLAMPILESFDQAENDRSTPARFSTTQPTQALAMINGAFLNRQAGLLADRIRREAGDDLKAQIRLALKLATAREASDDEVGRGLALIESLAASGGLDPEAARRAYCLLVLNLNEFLYLD